MKKIFHLGKKYLLKLSVGLLFFSLSFLILAKPTFSADGINVYLFWSIGCPHCAKEKQFLEKLVTENPQIKIRDYEVSKNRQNAQLFARAGQRLSAKASAVPFTVIGSQYIVGYLDDESSGKRIIEAIKLVEEGEDSDILADLIKGEDGEKERIKPVEKEKKQISLPQKLKFPLLGEIETRNLSLPALTVVMGLLDGFNPCAMWVLVFLISMLIGLPDTKRRWLLGITFIAASTLVYFLIMTAWLNLFIFLGFIFWVRLLVGITALGVGYYNLKEFITNPQAACKVTKNQNRRQILEKLKNITQRKELYLALIGIVLLAFAVNIIEAICSAGLPAIYTQLLTLNKLPMWQYYSYILLYLLFFMIDDIIVFSVAMVTLQVTGMETKYARYSHLIGGAIMFLIGLVLILKPELLMFG